MRRSLLAVTHRCFGTNEKAVKIRMKAVSSIGKITKAMKMVASSKMRADLSRLLNGKNFGFGLMNSVFDMDPNVKKRPLEPSTKPTLLLPITTDRGLCGGINSNLIRELRQVVGHDRRKYSIICIGEKGAQALARPFADILKESINELAAPINFANTAAVANYIASAPYEFENIRIIYNEFINSISSKVRAVELLGRRAFLKSFSKLCKFDISEPESEFAKNYFYELYVASTLYHCLLQNAACEQSARMNAMENASKNAKEILTNLTLQYNKARQARITMELVEIISGASAL